MTLTMAIIFFVLFLSVFLMIVEFFFIPGTTVFGIVGFVTGAIALYFAFKESNNLGYLSIGFSVVMFSVLFLFGRKLMKKSNLNLETEIKGKVNTYNAEIVNIGDIGITKSVLKPSGKAFIENKKMEVFSMGGYIESNVKIIVLKIVDNKIYVQEVA